MKQLDLQDARARLSDLVDRAGKGETFIIAKAGIPLAQLAPAPASERKPRKPLQYDILRGKVWIGADFDAPLSDADHPCGNGAAS